MNSTKKVAQVTPTERKGTFKVQYLREIEKRIQARWYESNIYDSDAPTDGTTREKFFTTFPFPYMNGRLHLGHTFSLSKCEFATRYQRLKGKRVLFPFGFHCTGMPIKACADKLKREMTEYGYPPIFPVEQVEEEKPIDDILKDRSKGKKSKAVAKSGSAKYQWQIMQTLGLSHEEIKQFADASHWLDHFPPLAVADLKSIGLHVDWRRIFITTDANPYFDSFVRWQFNRLKALQKVKYGKRYTIFSPKDNQPCMDHDRATGEGVGLQEYTLIKLKVLEPYPGKLRPYEGNTPLFLVAATLRPETMYGQTNCWVHPDVNYVAFVTKDEELFVCTMRSLLNMSYQEITATYGSYTLVAIIPGKDLIGTAVVAPMSIYPKVYTLPMYTIREDKGTGIVTSVPSDSPDDYAGLMDLKRKEALRVKHSIDEFMVNFDPVPIIDVPGYGTLSAKVIYEKLNIKSQNDKEKLQEAKEKVYLKGFYDGIMNIGEFKGKKVQEIKKILQSKLIESKEALLYHEPDKQIISRSGDECVVALCDQWYLDYGEKEWKKAAERALSKMNTYHEEVRKNFLSCLNWLHEYACSRTYGLGTKLPWDEQWLIESLSDSTIYNAYYTVSHLLQHGTFKGVVNGRTDYIKPEHMTDEVWNYIFLKSAPYPKNCKISNAQLKHMKQEFEYWYPVDLRCSGKDLIQNHLTFYIYNHCAIWPDEENKWPKGIRANGHLLLNSAKMSKSDGNFLTLTDAVDKFSADGMRLCLADSGDSIEDANFAESVADAGILRLYAFIEWVAEMKMSAKNLRTGPYNEFHDRVFLSEMNMKIIQTDNYYKNMLFKEALRTGFFEFQAAMHKYRELTATDDGMHRDLVFQYIELQALMLSPICPHVAEHVWALLGKEGFIVQTSWPKPGPIEDTLIEASVYLMEVAHSFRLQKKNYLSRKSSKKGVFVDEKPDVATVVVAKSYPPWQAAVLDTITELCENNHNSLPDNKHIASILSTKVELKRHMKKVMPFVQMIRQKMEQSGMNALKQNVSFDEYEVLNININYLKNTLELHTIDLKYTDADEIPGYVLEDCCPGNPNIIFGTDQESLHLKLINIEAQNGHFAHTVRIRDGDTVEKISETLIKELKNVKDKNKIEIWRYEDQLLGPRKLLNVNDPYEHKVKLSKDAVFSADVKKGVLRVKTTRGFEDMGDRAIYAVK